MRAVVQRVSQAQVRVEEASVGAIGPGLLVLLGVGQGDSAEEARFLAEKIVQLRIFSDAEGKFNLSALDIGGEVLVVSQFTLFADTRRGRRPSRKSGHGEGRATAGELDELKALAFAFSRPPLTTGLVLGLKPPARKGVAPISIENAR